MMFRALKGIEVAGTPYVTGETFDGGDLAPASRAWLLERGAIEPAEDVTPAAKASKKKGA